MPAKYSFELVQHSAGWRALYKIGRGERRSVHRGGGATSAGVTIMRGMADITLKGMGAIFGAGATVAAYPAGSRGPSGANPSAASVASATVTGDNAGSDSLAFTGLTADVPYVAYGSVSGKYVPFRISAFVAATKWKDRIAARRAAIGTS